MQNQIKRRPWTAYEKSLLVKSTQNHTENLTTCFVSIAEQTGRTPGAVYQYYNALKKSGDYDYIAGVQDGTDKAGSKWDEDEEQILIKQIKSFPSNITQCCAIVAEQVHRTPSAVAAHWYAKTSRRPDVKAFFTASSSSVSMNRKNGKGVVSTTSIWTRLLKVLQSIGL